MQDTNLICTLTDADYRDREAAWRKLGDYVTGSAVIPGGIRLNFAPIPGLSDSLTELVRLEAECCAWMAFAVSEFPDEIKLSITSNGEDGARAVREAFEGLLRSSPSGGGGLTR